MVDYRQFFSTLKSCFLLFSITSLIFLKGNLMSPLISGRLFCNVNNPIFYFLIWGMLFPIECPSHTDGELAVSTISSPCFHHSLSLKESYILSKWNLCFRSGKSSPNHPHSFHPLIQLSGTCCGCFCFEQDFELALECAQVAAGWVL